MAKFNPTKEEVERFCAGLKQAVDSLYDDEPPRKSAAMPGNKDIPKTYEQPARRTVYSRDPKICKHQFANGRKVCPYCATTNPNM